MRIIGTTIRYYKNTELRNSSIDPGILPLIKVLNNWKKHPDWHFTGLVTIFSCEGHRKNETYISFHSSRLVAHFLAECVKKYKNKTKWKINYASNWYKLEATIKGKNYTDEIKALASFLKQNFQIPKSDYGWRVFPSANETSLYEIHDAISYEQIDEIASTLLDYIISRGGKITKSVLMEFMKLRFRDWPKIVRVYTRLVRLGLISTRGKNVHANLNNIKETSRQVFIRRRTELCS